LAIKLLATGEGGKFKGIACRSAICEAMANRDATALDAALTRIEAQAMHGGLTVVFGRRLVSELSKLLADWKFIEGIADNYDYLFVVEAFLGECGRLAYRGEEMFAAVELRQSLLIRVR
jgi:hypothetical protein